MERASLENLQRDELIQRARAAGVERAQVLTRDELIDELLRRAQRSGPVRASARGFFGRARDLIATVLEKGLHLPEAAERLRNPPSARSDEEDEQPAPLATVTLAEIYAAQGHSDRAMGVLDDVLAREPEHEAARLLRTRLAIAPAVSEHTALGGSSPLETAGAKPEINAASSPDASAPGTGPIPMLDDGPLPERYDVDEAVVMPVDPTTAYVYWEIREDTVRRLSANAPNGHPLVRLFALGRGGLDGSHVVVRDIRADAWVGDTFVYDLPEGSRLHVALGWLNTDGAYYEVYTGPTYTTPPAGPAPVLVDTIARWSVDTMTVVGRVGDANADAAAAPLFTVGSTAGGLVTDVLGASPFDEAPAWLPREEGYRWVRVVAPLGSSEQWIRQPLPHPFDTRAGGSSWGGSSDVRSFASRSG